MPDKTKLSVVIHHAWILQQNYAKTLLPVLVKAQDGTGVSFFVYFMLCPLRFQTTRLLCYLSGTWLGPPKVVLDLVCSIHCLCTPIVEVHQPAYALTHEYGNAIKLSIIIACSSNATLYHLSCNSIVTNLWCTSHTTVLCIAKLHVSSTQLN